MFRAVYKYSLGLSEQDQSKPHTVINVLKEYNYGAIIGVLGERRKVISLLQNEENSIARVGRQRFAIKTAQCMYENFAVELMKVRLSLD